MDINENDIAVVGMALRVPGAHDPRQYWRNLRDGVESIRFYSDEQLLAEGERPEKLRKSNYVRAGAPLDGMELFDGEFFGFSPKESAILDPQHRHFLECAWEAFESSGHPPEQFDGPIGVFAGCGMGSYFYFNLCSNPDLVESVGMFLLRHTGNDKDFLATRVSYLFNLTGPSVNVQTACSTSLVAVHMASQSLLSRECDMALAGGVTIELPHRRGYLYQPGEVLSPDGHCHAFDHRGEGTVFGSGGGAVVLRRLEDAIADGDHVHAVIKSTAINNDGSSKVGYLAPSVDGQAKAMVESHALADIEADTIQYVECHGTGTTMGDPIEVEALGQAFRQSTDRTRFCRIGSVKSNIGHLDTAAGIASFIKAVLALEHRQMPPSLSFEKPNPNIDWDNSPFVVNDELRDWPREGTPRRAAVNSLGVGGTNAHAILEEAPELPESGAAERPYQLLMLSARNRSSLDELSKKLAAHLRDTDQKLADIAHTLRVGRRTFDRRRVVAARDLEEAAKLLEEGDPRRVFTHEKVADRPSVVFMFPGGGAQFVGMGKDLYESQPVFREHLDHGLEYLAPKLDYDLKALMFAEGEAAEEAAERMKQPSVQLPAILMVEYALAKLWMSWGIEPAALIGHSMGENTAACIAGVLSYEEAIDLVLLRGKLFDSVPPGGMISVPISAEELEPFLGDDCDLASDNSPELSVASGSNEALEALAARLLEKGHEAQRVDIDIAAHSRMLEDMLEPWRAHLKSLKLKPPQIPFISNRTGTFITNEQATDPEYWVQHLRNTVRFGAGIRTLAEEPGRVYIEVGPGKAMSSLAKQNPGTTPQAVFSSLRHPDQKVSDEAYFVSMLGRAWGCGVQFDVGRFWEGETRRRVPLPTYAFSHQHFFIEPGKVQVREESASNLQKVSSIEDWGWRPVWKKRLPEIDPEVETPTTWLFFMDEADIGLRLADRLRRAGHTVVAVYPGDAYMQRSDVEYVLSPERGRDGYDALVHDLVASGKAPTRIVHLWMVTADESYRPGSSFFHRNQERGFYSLFFLAQALGDESVPRPLHLTVISNGMQRVADEALPYPEKATVLGPAKVIPKELPGVTCSTVDVVLPEVSRRLFGGRLGMALVDPFAGKKAVSQGFDELVEALEEDLLGTPDNTVVAHRNGRRYEQQYTRRMLPPLAEGELGALREGGVYLITGGLGDLGLVLSRHLAKRARAKLVLVTRSGLPPREEWDAHVAEHGVDDARSRRMIAVRDMEADGADVLVVAADVTNVEQMRGVLAQAKERFGAIHGVIHTAGIVRDELILVKSLADIEDVFTPKIHGTLVLDAVFAETDLDFMALFSSTSAATAPVGQVDYVAANAFLNAYAESRAGRGARRTVALGWGIWNQVGMAARAFAEQMGAPEEEVTGPAEHPLFAEHIRDFLGLPALTAHISPEEDWFLHDHRTLAGHALVPGTGYVELARAALREHGEEGPFEISDLYFLRPLYVPDDEKREMRVRLRRNQRGYAFEVRSEYDADGRRGWQLHSQADLVIRPLSVPSPVSIEEIDGRCQVDRSPVDPSGIRSPQEAHLCFGPRWRVMHQACIGDGEALAHLVLPEEFVDDLPSWGLHPALLDFATGFAMQLIEGYEGTELWVPLSYDRIRVYGDLPQKVYSWVRNHGDNQASAGFAFFDVTIADEDGNVLVEVERFSIKRMEGDVDFAVATRPSPAELELEPEPKEGVDEDDLQLSPAEEQLRHNLSQGILPAEGASAFERALSSDPIPEIVVSSLELPALINQAQANAQQHETGGQKFARPNLDSEYVAPRDEVERTLVAFFEELLGVDKVGVNDSFFDLGGHSLIAVRLFAKVKQTYNAEFPISVLFEAPTVERCAKLVREVVGGDAEPGEAAEKEPRSRYTHLVPMHPGEGGASTPFFLVAGMFGNVLNLRHVAHLLGTDRPFYGLQARGLYGDQKPHETFEEAARDYLAEMRTIQPEGPYMLGGFSGGGITAYEMAHQLRDAGEQVSLLVMLDTPLPTMPSLSPKDRAIIQVQRLQKKGPAYIAEWAKSRLEWEMGKIRRRFEEPEQLGQHEFHNEEIEAAFRRALQRYQMRPYDGTLTLVRPKLEIAYDLGEGRYLDWDREYVYEDNGWGSHVRDVVVHEVPGDHDSMVLEPNVRVLASRLEACMEEAEAQRSEVSAAE